MVDKLNGTGLAKATSDARNQENRAVIGLCKYCIASIITHNISTLSKITRSIVNMLLTLPYLMLGMIEQLALKNLKDLAQSDANLGAKHINLCRKGMTWLIIKSQRVNTFAYKAKH